ncbi:MAG: L,D-transpeptidase family protein [Gammaproteobacteria bacterium]|nr:L,D-transpeptidase family protein [Gammaproteobacteria bacterium]
MNTPPPTLFRAALAAALLMLPGLSRTVFAQAQEPLAREASVRVALAARSHLSLEPWDQARWREPLLALYATRQFAPLWIADGRPTRAALGLLGQLRAATERGLKPGDYDVEGLDALVARTPPDGAAATRLDVALSIAAARFVADLHAGRVDPRRAGYDLDVPHARLDVAAALAALAASTDPASVLDGYEPPFRHYRLLKWALARYRALAAQLQLTDLPPLPARRVGPGEAYAGAGALRGLLGVLGDLPPSSTATVGPAESLDPDLVEGLKSFQSRHGLTPDGVLGRETWRALTVPLAERVRQIERAMERVRYLPPKIETPPIIVNIPQFRLFAFRSDEDREDQLLTMPVIVGRSFPSLNTPVFAADMREVVLRPYWDVPSSIVRHEILPKIQTNPGWLVRNGYELVAGPGDDSPVVAPSAANVAALAAGRLRLRQRPGPENSLGLVKFLFPNRHNVYLHGTPAQQLFARARRDFSHGCVRVADPLALAAYVLRDDPQWPPERIEAAMNGSSPTRIAVRRPLRVFLIYVTALVSERGKVLFFEDIYGWDARLEQLLTARRR